MRQLFYYKVRQVLLQSATGITKCDNFITKSDNFIRKCDNFIRKCDNFIRKCDNFITKCDSTKKCTDYYKVQQYRVSQEVPSSPLTAIAILQNALHFGHHDLQHLERK